jgi:CheY-like chemotaxis protein
MAHILIVEDDAKIAEAFGLALKQGGGHSITLASSGAEALTAALEQKPDVILLDLLMPEMNGVEFLSAFNTSAHPDTQVIVFTNMVADSTVEAVRAMGVTHILTKAHYTPQDMVKLVAELIHN